MEEIKVKYPKLIDVNFQVKFFDYIDEIIDEILVKDEILVNDKKLVKDEKTC